MRKILVTLSFVLLNAASAAAQTDSSNGSEWWLLVFTGVILGALALYIYYRVNEAGFLTFLPQTAALEEE